MAKITFDYFEIMEIWSGEAGTLETVGGEDIPTGRRGKYMRLDTTTGKAVYGNGSSATEVGVLRGLALENQKYLGDPVTLLRHGLVDIGNELDGLDFGDPVYIDDDDGALATTAGDSAEAAIAGRVWPVVQHDGTVLKKLMINLL